VPPVASSDPTSYAAYGRIAALGRDPYVDTPADLAQDPVASRAEPPWRSAPSVYGPLATWEQRALADSVGANPRLLIGLLGLVNGVAFLAAAILLVRAAHTEADRRRVAVFVAANPLLLFEVVAGAHLDALVLLPLAAALAVYRRRDWVAGGLGGLAVLVKLNAVLAVAGLAVPLARRRKRFGSFVALAGLVVVAGYAAVGLHAFDQVRRAASFVSVGSPWRAVRSWLESALGHAAGAHVTAALAGAAFVVVCLSLAIRLPRGPLTAAFVLSLAYALTTPYVLPWYDVSSWALLALVAAPVALEWLLLAHTSVLALAYLPGRDVPLPSPWAGIFTNTRAVAAPVVLTAIVAVVLWGGRPLGLRAATAGPGRPRGVGRTQAGPARGTGQVRGEQAHDGGRVG
jgi:hypothetical protein